LLAFLLAQSKFSTIAVAMAANKPFVMFETNTASCGGFIGLSDSFGAAMYVFHYVYRFIKMTDVTLFAVGQSVRSHFFSLFTSIQIDAT
jgi:hypothetical protein